MWNITDKGGPAMIEAENVLKVDLEDEILYNHNFGGVCVDGVVEKDGG